MCILRNVIHYIVSAISDGCLIMCILRNVIHLQKCCKIIESNNVYFTLFYKLFPITKKKQGLTMCILRNVIHFLFHILKRHV